MIEDLPRFHYITGSVPRTTYKKLVEDACMAGVELIHLKVDNLDYDLWLETAVSAREYCEMYGTKLVIHNHARIAKEVKAYALYIEEGESIALARETVGSEMLLGASANSAEDVQRLIEEGLDYIGIGPYKPSGMESKPALGSDSIKKIVVDMENSFFKIPLIAFGGITHDDVYEVMQTGVYGIGVGSGISQAGRRQLAAQEYVALVDEFMHDSKNES